ncbi:MAG TPA: hypothetical protein VNB22_08675 [Pyrinomonadaceae bacterium]|nr:hypothetical protein [Pyrinomonadaceae bacterium]
MSIKSFWKLGSGIALSIAFSSFALAQDTTTKTTTTTTTTKSEVVQNADGTYSVIEYPVGKEVTVQLTPYNLQGASGTARVLRAADGTKIYLDLAGVTGDAKSYYAYAVDPKGVPTLLGPVMIENGIAKAEFTTPMNQFMVVLSPNEGVTSFSSDIPVTFRSAVPTGYAVVPVAVTSDGGGKQIATTTEVASTYEVPLLNVAKFDKNKDSEIRINFSGELQGLKGKAYLSPTKDGVTKIKMRFDEMKMAPKNARFILWASSPDGKYTKLGQVINNGNREESEIRSETALADFGLFVTVENTDVATPTSKIYSVFSVTP